MNGVEQTGAGRVWIVGAECVFVGKRKGFRAFAQEEKNISKWYGIYSSRQPGNHMARIVVPGGVLTSTQARTIARVAEKYAMGRLNVTTRTSIQLHWLKLGSLADVMRDLAAEGTTTKHGCGDVTPNVTACPLAESCRHRRFSVLPYAQRTAKRCTIGRQEQRGSSPNALRPLAGAYR